MSRFSNQAVVSQRSRTQNNPLFLGTFSQTSLRYLKGKLEPTYQVQSNGIGGGTYNHWFSVELTSPAWIILTKDGERSKYIQLSFYDLNQIPIQGRSIFQADSVPGNFYTDPNENLYYPYVGHAMAAQSDLYNTFDPYRIDKGDDRYYPLGAGKYLICVSNTRNEPIDYNVGVVIEFPSEDLFILLEDLDGSRLILETTIDTTNTNIIGPVFNSDYVITSGQNAYTLSSATISVGATVTVSNNSSWLIGLASTDPNNFFILDAGPGYDFNSDHEHSLAEWKEAWNREHQQTDQFPEVFVPLTTRP